VAPAQPAAALMNDQHFANHEEFEATQNAIASWLDARQQNIQIASDGLLHFRVDSAALRIFDQEKITYNHPS
jgi:hypothetical protein